MLEDDQNSIEVSYSAERGPESSWKLRLPEVCYTSTTLDGGSVNWALLTGKKRVQHLSATFGKARQALVAEGLDVTEETPWTVVYFSPTDKPRTWIRHAFYSFGLAPNKQEIIGDIRLASEAELSDKNT